MQRDNEVKCGECIYNHRDRGNYDRKLYFCGNENSDHYGEYTAYTDSCEEGEQR